MQKFLVTMMALALTVSAQVQAQEDGGLADLKADMMAAMVHQDSIDTASLMAVYDYECHTQDADGEAFDLLHQLSSTQYDINAQGRIVTWYRSLPHYVMLHLVYRWNKNPKKK